VSEIQATYLIVVLAIVAIGFLALSYSGMLFGKTGYLTLSFTDKPGDIDTSNVSSISVTVDKVKVHRAGTGGSADNEVNDSPATGQEAAKESNDTDANEVTAQWDTIVDSPHTYDLLQLVNNPTQVFAGKTLTAGKYTQIRLEVSKAVITFKDGSTANVTVPSNRFYWVRSFDIVQGKTTTLTLDFNAAQTVSQDGQGKYIIAPVAKVVSTTS